MDLLRVATAGSVDDGKSTLIGRLSYDSKSLSDDVIAADEDASRRQQSDYLNLGLVTDGLRSEREQGITIDVAYRYFSTLIRSSSWRIRQGMFSTPATWSQGLSPLKLRSS